MSRDTKKAPVETGALRMREGGIEPSIHQSPQPRAAAGCHQERPKSGANDDTPAATTTPDTGANVQGVGTERAQIPAQAYARLMELTDELGEALRGSMAPPSANRSPDTDGAP